MIKFKFTFCNLVNDSTIVINSFKSEEEAKEWATGYLAELTAIDSSYCGFSYTVEGATVKLYTRKDGILALKPERQAACVAAGVEILEIGETMPENGILIADTRPKKFVGGRGPDDPAATMLYVGDVFNPRKKFYFEDFERALKKAVKLAS